jgi:hypothetical protein
MFITGQKVVCINGTFTPEIAALYLALPKEGETYTVRGSTVGVHNDGRGTRVEGEICIYLVGLINPTGPKGNERGFLADRFRPLEELTTEEIIGDQEPVHIGVEHDDADWWKKAA